MTEYVFIVNPTAGSGDGASFARTLRRRLDALEIACDICLAQSEEDTVLLASTRAADARCLVAVGGDGTVHRVGLGLIESGARVDFAVLPLGTGNDYAKALGLPLDFERALEKLLTAQPIAVDYGKVRWREAKAPTWSESIFLNVLGVGLDAVVARRVSRRTWLPGVVRYAAAGVMALPGWGGPAVEVGAADEEGPLFRDELLLMSVGNGATSGGGFHLTPDARIDDGVLDVCLVRHVSFLRALQLLPFAIIGQHTSAREVTMVRKRRLSVRSSAPVPVHADGEVVSSGAVEIEIEVVPSGLVVRRPCESLSATPGRNR